MNETKDDSSQDTQSSNDNNKIDKFNISLADVTKEQIRTVIAKYRTLALSREKEAKITPPLSQQLQQDSNQNDTNEEEMPDYDAVPTFRPILPVPAAAPLPASRRPTFDIKPFIKAEPKYEDEERDNITEDEDDNSGYASPTDDDRRFVANQLYANTNQAVSTLNDTAQALVSFLTDFKKSTENITSQIKTSVPDQITTGLDKIQASINSLIDKQQTAPTLPQTTYKGNKQTDNQQLDLIIAIGNGVREQGNSIKKILTEFGSLTVLLRDTEENRKAEILRTSLTEKDRAAKMTAMKKEVDELDAKYADFVKKSQEMLGNVTVAIANLPEQNKLVLDDLALLMRKDFADAANNYTVSLQDMANQYKTQTNVIEQIKTLLESHLTNNSTSSLTSTAVVELVKPNLSKTEELKIQATVNAAVKSITDILTTNKDFFSKMNLESLIKQLITKPSCAELKPYMDTLTSTVQAVSVAICETQKKLLEDKSESDANLIKVIQESQLANKKLLTSVEALVKNIDINQTEFVSKYQNVDINGLLDDLQKKRDATALNMQLVEKRVEKTTQEAAAAKPDQKSDKQWLKLQEILVDSQTKLLASVNESNINVIGDMNKKYVEDMNKLMTQLASSVALDMEARKAELFDLAKIINNTSVNEVEKLDIIITSIQQIVDREQVPIDFPQSLPANPQNQPPGAAADAQLSQDFRTLANVLLEKVGAMDKIVASQRGIETTVNYIKKRIDQKSTRLEESINRAVSSNLVVLSNTLGSIKEDILNTSTSLREAYSTNQAQIVQGFQSILNSQDTLLTDTTNTLSQQINVLTQNITTMQTITQQKSTIVSTITDTNGQISTSSETKIINLLNTIIKQETEIKSTILEISTKTNRVDLAVATTANQTNNLLTICETGKESFEKIIAESQQKLQIKFTEETKNEIVTTINKLNVTTEVLTAVKEGMRKEVEKIQYTSQQQSKVLTDEALDAQMAHYKELLARLFEPMQLAILEKNRLEQIGPSASQSNWDLPDLPSELSLDLAALPSVPSTPIMVGQKLATAISNQNDIDNALSSGTITNFSNSISAPAEMIDSEEQIKMNKASKNLLSMFGKIHSKQDSLPVDKKKLLRRFENPLDKADDLIELLTTANKKDPKVGLLIIQLKSARDEFAKMASNKNVVFRSPATTGKLAQPNKIPMVQSGISAKETPVIALTKEGQAVASNLYSDKSSLVKDSLSKPPAIIESLKNPTGAPPIGVKINAEAENNFISKIKDTDNSSYSVLTNSLTYAEAGLGPFRYETDPTLRKIALDSIVAEFKRISISLPTNDTAEMFSHLTKLMSGGYSIRDMVSFLSVIKYDYRLPQNDLEQAMAADKENYYEQEEEQRMQAQYEADENYMSQDKKSTLESLNESQQEEQKQPQNRARSRSPANNTEQYMVTDKKKSTTRTEKRPARSNYTSPRGYGITNEEIKNLHFKKHYSDKELSDIHKKERVEASKTKDIAHRNYVDVNLDTLRNHIKQKNSESRNSEKIGMGIKCSHCDKEPSSEQDTMHISKSGELMHKKCFVGKGMTSKRKLLEHDYGEDVTEESARSPKAKEVLSTIKSKFYAEKLKNTKFETNWSQFKRGASSVLNVDAVIHQAKHNSLFTGPFNENQLNKFVTLVGYVSSGIDHMNKIDHNLVSNLEVGAIQFLKKHKSKTSSLSHGVLANMPYDSFEAMKRYIIENPDIVRIMEFQK